jgi:hypothetical protein
MMKLNDPLCEQCPNKVMKDKKQKIRCPALCLPMIWINGRTGRKENLLRKPLEERPYEDYNDILSKLIAQKRENHIEAIRNIEDITIRALAAMLWADISMAEIAKITRTNRTTFYKKIASFTKDIK